MIAYISGPMTGLPDYNRPAFYAAEDALHSAGFDVLSPGRIGDMPGWGWRDYMRAALRLMLEADVVFVLPGWQQSTGARVEVDLAKAVEIPVRRIEEIA